MHLVEKSIKNKTILSKLKYFFTKQTKISDLKKELAKISKELPSHYSSSDRVLIWRGPGGTTPSLSIELIIGAALALRGVQVKIILCDGLLSGCIQRSIHQKETISEWAKQCDFCYKSGESLLNSLGLPYQVISDYLEPSLTSEIRNIANEIELEKIFNYQDEGIAIGNHTCSAVERYFQGQGIQRDDFTNQILREYFYSSLIATKVSKKLLEIEKPTKIFMQHGIYVDWGPTFDVALNKDIPVIRWMRGYLKNHLYLRTATRQDSRHMYYITEEEWLQSKPLTQSEEKELEQYMESRKTGSNLKVKLFKSPPKGSNYLQEELELSPNKPVWGLFTHLNWDAVFAFEPMAFTTPTEWLLESIQIMSQIKEITWIIKIHPAERVLGTVMGSLELINKEFVEFPSNIKIISADSTINTYDLLPILDGGVTIRGTVGIELALLGKPTILAGEAHYGSKGFTYDGYGKESYFSLLKQTPFIQPLDSHQINLAKQYAHNFFIERQIPFPFPYQSNLRQELKPNHNKVIEKICSRILNGGQFSIEKNKNVEANTGKKTKLL